MSENNFMITPGTYKLNQSWKFEDGLFKINNGKKQEIFKFKTKQLSDCNGLESKSDNYINTNYAGQDLLESGGFIKYSDL